MVAAKQDTFNQTHQIFELVQPDSDPGNDI